MKKKYNPLMHCSLYLEEQKKKEEKSVTYTYQMGEAERAFQKLSNDEQVAVMINLYYTLSDSQKDQFLKETENS